MGETAHHTRPRQEAAASYDRLSGWYDLLTGPFEARYRQEGLRRLGPRQGEAILEIGFGTGHGLVALARAVGRQGRVYGLDLSRGMCRVARRRLTAAALAGRVGLVRGDARALPFTAGAFDALFLSFTLELFDEQGIPVVLSECRRVLRPGGRLGVVAMAEAAHPGAMSRVYAWLHARFPRYVDCRPIPVREVLSQAGLIPVAVERFAMAGLPVAVAVGRRPCGAAAGE